MMLSQTSTFRTAHALLELHVSRRGGQWLWIIERCPNCGRRHVHGGGSVADDPRRMLGGRGAHCEDAGVDRRGRPLPRVERPDYELVDARPERTALLVAEHGGAS